MILESTEQFLSGGGEMGKLIRAMDWSKTALGPVENWPQSLRTSVSLCLSSTFPILIAWGPETIQIYNDSYRPICGAKHPESMGQNFRICWETALPVVGDAFARGEQGEGTYISDQRMFLDRYGYLEESWMTFSFAPIRDESGGVGGIFHPITETTVKMLSARRTQVLRDLGESISKVKSLAEIGRVTAEKYQDYVLDIPFLMLYEIDHQQGIANLINHAGLEAGTLMVPDTIDIKADTAWPVQALLQDGMIQEVTDLGSRFGEFTCQPYDISPSTAMLVPLRLSGQEELFGFIIAGVSACRALDTDYSNFYNLLGNTFNTAISNVYAYEQEQKRAEALAAIDRSKTAFFSNVSHEFRTPLTLMLGPLEDLLSKNNLDQESRSSVDATHRNALRLLKLVNNLLDYSRVEAGRAQAAYQQVNLCESTVDLASSFRSIIEKAGMKLNVDCHPHKDEVYVDRQMWEKIVLNLLSNAFKYTLEGSITISLAQVGRSVVLKVSDTGVGIPEKELPHMFERFHRVENSAGRTHEGTGIGLSLVHELVHLHGGQITVDSVEGEGSTFTVQIPVGKHHLPQEHVLDTAKETDSSALKGAFIQEAFSLLQDEGKNIAPQAVITETGDVSGHRDISEDKDTHVLIVDDNGDMRAYLKRLLDPYFTITTAKNGAEALQIIKSTRQDLILSDVMMPVMDGKAMLRVLRNEPETSTLPVIFLSARAGEEARIDGLEAGADDYLVKPFSAAELLTKVRAQIKIIKVRGHAEYQLRRVLREAPVAIAIYRGADHVVELANDRMLGYWGKIAEQVIGTSLFTALPELETQGFKDVMDKVLQTGEHFVSQDIPVDFIHGNQIKTLYINLTIECLKDENGQATGLMAVAADVTGTVMASKELEQANAALAKANDTLNLAMDAAGMGIWRTDWGTDELIVSDRARLIHGIPFGTKLSFHETLEVVIPEHRERVYQAIAKAVENKGGFSEDYQVQPVDGGKRKWLNTTGKVELDENGEVKFVIGTILDITERREDELRKNDFIGMVSHELKTPLTSLNGYAQLLQMHARKTSDSFAKDKLDKMTNQFRKMTTMINGFLNVSRLESGKIQLNKEPFEVSQLVREMIEETESYMTSHEITFNSVGEMMITADRDKIGSVLSNLLGNAIKYSPNNAPIQVSCKCADGEVIVSIKDHGIGIKQVDQEKLFDRYYRAGNHQHVAGFGIGLYLSAEIVERHNGRIWVTSDLGHGSEFSFSLPVA
ncbi:ATP-binding protein [Mucilaginibacter sp. RS28]|uniref:histidine kinase n=1 Tax=Mucilaginibacter straminoryzae TaxID=2932774 RepID=A0A9X2B9W0_9SPHI|nr:ATP-binding protein [Mucilaginibacter straminoryzae]MCJ8210826.1 ATP-binding protein [Mucilaginibacter straminoryzae]